MKNSKEFKEEALKLSNDIEPKKVCTAVGYLEYYSVSDWCTKRSAVVKAKKYHMSDDEAKLRITELER